MKGINNTNRAQRELTWAILSLFLFIFSSCDPAHILRIENETDSKAKVTFVFKQGDYAYNFNEDQLSDTLVVELDSTVNNVIREYHFGLGNWKVQNVLDSLCSAVEFIEIETKNSREIFAGEDQINAFFRNRLSKKHKELIEIILK